PAAIRVAISTPFEARWVVRNKPHICRAARLKLRFTVRGETNVRTLAQKHNHLNQKSSASRTRSNTHPALHLQRTIGNKAVSGVIQRDRDKRKPGKSASEEKL